MSSLASGDEASAAQCWEGRRRRRCGPEHKWLPEAVLCEAAWALPARSVPRETPWQSTVVSLACEHETRPEASPQAEMETVRPTGNCPVTRLLI